MTWDGKERRGMNQDQIDRDRMLTEVHTNVKHIVDWSKAHDEKDDTRFASIQSKVDWTTKICYIGIGGAIVINALLKFIN